MPYFSFMYKEAPSMDILSVGYNEPSDIELE